MEKNNLEKFIRNERHDFAKADLEPSDLLNNPLEQLKVWIQEAIDNGTPEPYALNLATCVNNIPSVRVIYVREFYNHGLVFYTNYESKKGRELAQNPHAAMNFFWAETERQVRMEGRVEKAPVSLSDAYFAARPHASKIGAWASAQSHELKSRTALNEAFEKLQEKYKNSEIPRPDFWGGYVFIPHYFEFWQGRKNRLHDRISFTLVKEEWKISRLYP